MIQLHQDAELRHGQSGRFDELTPAAHGAVHEGVHPLANDLGKGL